MKKTRTRFAPSPTGYLHIGGLQSALYDYIWAKKQGGDFILRIEDTDQSRLVEGAISQITASLNWAGLVPNEGVISETDEQGELGPYKQSDRLDIYLKYAQRLLDEGKAYKCYCSSDRLQQMREVQRAAKQTPKYDRHCYNISAEEKSSLEGQGFVVRFFVPDGAAVIWDDAVFGEMKFDREQVDDFIMLKADKFPTYNFANVIDDHLMKISHVIRGQEFLPSTPKHLLIYDALGWKAPVLAHVTWILGKNKKKLSKREGDVAVDEYRKKGFLPIALLNYISLLGWNPKDNQEILSLEEIIKKFELKDLQRASAVFDIEKLEWMNGQYIRQMSIEDFTEVALPFLLETEVIAKDGKQFINKVSTGKISLEQLQKMLGTEQGRVKRLDQIAERITFFLKDKLEYDKKMLIWKKGDPKDLPDVFAESLKTLEQINESSWNEKGIQASLQTIVKTMAKGVGDVFWPIRIALSGQQNSPGPQEIAAVLGKKITLKRIQAALDKL